MTTDQVKRKLAAILSADVQGYSRLMGEDEEGTIRALKAHLEVISRFIAQHQGRVVGTGGDSVLAEFTSVVDAVRCAVAIQGELGEMNKDLAADRRLEFRIGVNLGDVVEEGDTILGDGVNIAARLESLAEAGGICISGTAFDQVRNKLELGYEYLGEQTVKNIALPVRAYKVLMEPEAVGKVIEGEKPRPKRWGWKAITGVTVIVLASLGLIWNFYWRTPQMAVARVEKMAFPLPDKPSIAVLPFVNLNNDPKEDYLSDGLTEQIITSLSSFGRLFVIARNSTFVYKGKPVKVQKVAEDLGVQYVLEGSVQKSGNRIRITAQLIDALKGHHIWGERYDREVKDIFALQDEITIKILDAMKLGLTEGTVEHQYVKIKTNNLKAYEKHYQGVGFFRRYTKQDNEKARRLFEEAIALDPKYYWPHVLLGYTYYTDARYGWSEFPAQSIKKAFECAQKAIAMESSLDPGHNLLAFVYLLMRQHDKAIAEAGRSVALNPNGAFAYFALAGVVGSAGQWDQSLMHVKQAMRLNPIHEHYDYYMLGRAYFMTSKYDEAIGALKKAIKAAPNFPPYHLMLAAAYSSSGRNAEAAAAGKEVLRINPQFSVEAYSKVLPYKNKADIDRELAALRQAGLK